MDITIPNDDVCIMYPHTYFHQSLAYQSSSPMHYNIPLVSEDIFLSESHQSARKKPDCP